MRYFSYITTNRGKILENFILEKINKEHKKKFVKNNKIEYYDLGAFKICGIIDGIDRNAAQILEIKTRKTLDMEKDSISHRERVQALCYMKMFECRDCLFVESGPEGVQKTTILDWDEKEFNCVVDKLTKFTEDAKSLTRKDFESMVKSAY